MAGTSLVMIFSLATGAENAGVLSTLDSTVAENSFGGSGSLDAGKVPNVGGFAEKTGFGGVGRMITSSSSSSMSSFPLSAGFDDLSSSISTSFEGPGFGAGVKENAGAPTGVSVCLVDILGASTTGFAGVPKVKVGGLAGWGSAARGAGENVKAGAGLGAVTAAAVDATIGGTGC